jgi:hypothetical protein
LISTDILLKMKEDMKGSHFMAPFCAALIAFSASVMFLAFDLFVAIILAYTSAET